MSFKVGQKVVFTFKGMKMINKNIAPPSEGEIVKISGIFGTCYCGCGLTCYTIDGYESDKFGRHQNFSQDYLRPLDETFADEVLERIKEQINEEQLVRI